MSRRARLAWISFAAVMFAASAALLMLSAAPSVPPVGALRDIAVPLDPARLTGRETLTLETVRYQASAFALGQVTVAVRNPTDRAQDGWVWFILAPPDAAEAWREAVYTSPEQALALPPGGLQTLTFDPPAESALSRGGYRLSVWVHGVAADGARIHSDAAGAADVQFLGEPYLLIENGVSRSEQIDGSSAIEVMATVENQSGVPLDARTGFSVIALSNAGVASGGNPPDFDHPGYVMRLESGEQATFTLRGSARLAPGRYRVIVWLRDADEQELKRIIAETALSV